MNRPRLLGGCLLTGALALSACGRTGHEPAGPLVLAAVNGTAITADDLSAKLGDHDLSDSTLKDRALDAIIAEELMFQKAVQLGFDKDPKFQERIRIMEARITAYKRAEMGRRVRDTQVASHVTVSDQEVRDYFVEHLDAIRSDLHLGVLQFGDPPQANGALARIRAGTPFETIAAEHPEASGGTGAAWNWGFRHWDDIPEALEGAFKLKKGEVDLLGSGPSKTSLVKVIDVKDNPGAQLEAMRASIEHRLWTAKGREAYEHYIAQLRQGAAITRNRAP